MTDAPETIEQAPDGSFAPAVIEPRHNLPAAINLDEVERVAMLMASSGFFKDSTEMAQAAVKVMAGRELGFAAIQAMTAIYIVKGRVTLGGMAIGTLIKRSGRYNYRIVQHTDEVCEIAFFERNGDSWDDIGHSSFDVKDAEVAGLLPAPPDSPWNKHRRNMLFNRTISNGAKWHTPDVFGGPIYTPEELGALVDGNGDMLPVAPPQAPATHTDAHLSPTDEQRAKAKLIRGALTQVDAGFDDRMRRYVVEEIDEVGLKNLTRGGYGPLLDWMAAEAREKLPEWDFETGEPYVLPTTTEKPSEAPAAPEAQEPVQPAAAPEAPAEAAPPAESPATATEVMLQEEQRKHIENMRVQMEAGQTFRECQELVSGNIGDAGLILLMSELGIDAPDALDTEPTRSTFLEALEAKITEASA